MRPGWKDSSLLGPLSPIHSGRGRCSPRSVIRFEFCKVDRGGPPPRGQWEILLPRHENDGHTGDKTIEKEKIPSSSRVSFGERRHSTRRRGRRRTSFVLVSWIAESYILVCFAREKFLRLTSSRNPWDNRAIFDFRKFWNFARLLNFALTVEIIEGETLFVEKKKKKEKKKGIVEILYRMRDRGLRYSLIIASW